MEVPWLFLSHSGAQKDFTWRLYQELLHVRHSAFFDQDAQDSLPKGQPSPPRIVQSCRGCRMGIVVLSHEYLESLWPMLELEQLTFHNPFSHCILYPLFYRLHPADLSKEENLRRWQDKWESKASEWQSKVASIPSTSAHPQISINISSWPEALKMLRNQSGDVFHPMDEDAYMQDERAYIQTIVSNICKTIAPPRPHYLLDKHIRGMERLQQDIENQFQKARPKSGHSTSAVILGVWGLGGSGKTTLCKNMTNFYRGDFPGRSCLLELPTEEDEEKLVKAMKEVILTLGRAKKDEIEMPSSIGLIMSYLEEGLKGHQVFLAVDNVWDWTIERAEQIVSMACMVAGSKVLVTSRSKQVLERLLPGRIVPVPSITEDEAVEVLKSLRFFLPDVSLPELEDMKGLSRLCFFEGQCHPLLLKMMGDKLRHVGGRMNHEQGWKDLISRLQTHPLDDEQMENTILKVLETSFLALTPKLQNTFIDLVTCIPREPPPFKYKDFKGKCKWLSMINCDGFTKMDMRDQLIELEYHGLLEIKEDEALPWNEINIHDLHQSVARRRAAGHQGAGLFQGSLSDLSIDCNECRNTRCIVSSSPEVKVSSLRRVMRHCSKLEILSLQCRYINANAPAKLSVPSMRCLRLLELCDCTFLKKIEGWEGTPNLVYLKLRHCRSLQKLGDMGCLQKLEKLSISESSRCVPDLTQCSELKKLEFSHSDGLKDLASLGQPPKLRELNLSDNTNLKDVRTVSTFTALRKLNLSDCKNVKIILEGIVFPLTDMEELDLHGCWDLQRIPDLTNLARLKVFKADRCRTLEMVKLPITCSLQVLDLSQCSCLGQLSELPSGSLSRGLQLVLCDPGSISSQPNLLHRPVDGLGAFINLWELSISGDNCWNTSSLDVSDLTSLEKCYLRSFPALQEIQGLDALPKLKVLGIWNCSCLKRFLGSDVRVSNSIHDASDYQALYIKALDLGDSSTAQAPTPLFPTCLNELSITRCSSLTTLPSLRPAAGALKTLSLAGCVSLMDVSSLTTPLPFLWDLNLEGCSSLRELPNLTHLTSLRFIYLHKSLHTTALIALEYQGRVEIKVDEALWWDQIDFQSLHQSVARRRAAGQDADTFMERVRHLLDSLWTRLDNLWTRLWIYLLCDI